MRRNAISIVGLVVFLVCVMAFLLGNKLASAAAAGPARTLVLDLPEGKVIVELAAQKRDFLLQPVTGDKVPFYSPENAVRIADALQKAGQMEALPKVGEPFIESHSPPVLDEGPPCGQCANYEKLCGEVCCGAGGGCTWCTSCP